MSVQYVGTRIGDLRSDEAITFTPAGFHHRPDRA
ncbi:hypothetical protein HDA40_002433 [Hamadaea flava]|nr:hypothetical protein [Hamadaea flava]